MDKQKQIEELANVMLSNMERPKCFTSATEEQEFLNAYKLSFIGYATHLYNAGCRIINENAVVLTREEREEFNELYRSALQRAEKWEKLCGIKIKETRKETAEKFAERLKEELENRSAIDGYDLEDLEFDGKIIQECIDEICKEIVGEGL